MSTLADSMISSASRPLALRVRPDLITKQQHYHGTSYWIVKDPVGLNYYRFHDEEYAILSMLDGQTSMEKIKERFERQFTPQRIDFQDLQQFIGTLHRSGLVTSEASGQGRRLRERRDQKKKRELLGKFTNVFAIRFRGFDPERLLKWMYRYTKWIYSPVTIGVCLAMGLIALMLVFSNFDIFRAKLPTFHQFFGPHNWIYLGITLALVKILHEFGHGLTCKHFGGECHELGAMLLVFTPCLYCNVSDSWMLPNKWHRVAIGAGGMFVELTLASIATFIWWFTDSTSLINNICLSVMFICSVSTLLFNGNPLLRFDGYYIVMDILEIPNLRQKCSEVLKRFAIGVCLGIEQPDNPFLPQRRKFLFALYTIAAVIYRWVVVLSILWFLNKVLEPYGLQVIGRAIAMVGLFGLVIHPLYKMAKFFYVPGRMNKMKKQRLVATVGVVSAVVAAVVFVPLPYYVTCSFIIEPRDAKVVYAAVPGKLETAEAELGQTVAPGEILARMDDLDLRLKIVEMEGRLEEAKIQREYLTNQRSDNPQAVQRIETLETSISTLHVQLDKKKGELKQLTIVAPTGGTVLPAETRRPQSSGSDLPMMTTSPLHKENTGVPLAKQDMICRIGDPTRLEAILIIDQKDVDYVHEGDNVQLKLDSIPYATLSKNEDGKRLHIARIARQEMQASPRALTSQAGGELDTKVDSQGVSKPLSTSYRARVTLDDSARRLHISMRGRAKIRVESRTLGGRLWSFLVRTFRFDF